MTLVNAFVVLLFLHLSIEQPHTSDDTNGYDVFITQKDFLCDLPESLFAFCLKDGFKFDCENFGSSVTYETIGPGLIKLHLSYSLDPNELTDTIDFFFRDEGRDIRTSKKIKVHCFREILPKRIDVAEDGKNTFMITISGFEHFPLEGTVSADPIYGKVLTVSYSYSLLSLTYRRRFRYPYVDVISIKFHGRVQRLMYIYVPVPATIELSGKTEPFSRVSWKTLSSRGSLKVDSEGDFKISALIYPNEKEVELYFEDLVGNKTRERISIEYPERSTFFFEHVELGDKIIVFTNKSVRDKRWKRLSKHIYLLQPDEPGRHLAEIDGTKFVIDKKNFPAFMVVEKNFEHREIYADGTSRMVFSIKVKDVHHKEMKVPIKLELNPDIRGDGLEVKQDENVFEILVKMRMSDRLTIAFVHELLRHKEEISLVPGRPYKIDVEVGKTYIYGDGRDSAKLIASLQDRAGNIIPQKIDVLTDLGEVKEEWKDKDGRLYLSYSLDSKTNVRNRITLRYGDITEEVEILVLAKRGFFELSPNLGVISDLKDAFILIPYLRVSYARLIPGGVYLFFDSNVGVFRRAIRDVLFTSVYSSTGASTQIIFSGKEARIGFGVSAIFHSAFAGSVNVSEIIGELSPYVKLAFVVKRFSVDVFFLFPKIYQRKGFIRLRDSFVRSLFGASYIFEL